jgi:FKBP-type peptidyl-prolyl cis-trans isomerase FkpA
MKKNVMLFLALASVGFASCNGGYKQADGGLLYEIHVDKGGTPIQTGDFVTLNVVGKTDADSVLFSTYDNGRPAELLVQKPHKGDIFTGLEKLAEGDSATIKICADSIFKKGQPKPPGFKGKYVSYDIKIIKVIAKGKLSEAVFEGSINNYLKNEALGLKKLEPGKMKFYIAHEKLNVTQTPDYPARLRAKTHSRRYGCSKLYRPYAFRQDFR